MRENRVALNDRERDTLRLALGYYAADMQAQAERLDHSSYNRLRRADYLARADEARELQHRFHVMNRQFPEGIVT